MLRRKLLLSAGALAASLLSASLGHAQATFPSQPIKIVSPFAAGSVSDITLRVLGERLSVRLKTRVVIENMPTGGGIAAARAVISAPADGHTLALLSNATAVTVATFKTLPFDPIKDFVPVGGISEFAYLILVNNQSGYRSFSEFVAAARAKPGTLNIGTAAPGTTPHLLAVLLRKEAKVDFTIIPFRGATDLSAAIMRNDIDIFINAYGAVRGGLEEKRLRAIAATSAARAKKLPDVPTIQEQGVPGFEVSSWNGLFAPAGTPQAAIDILSRELKAVLAEPEVVEKLVGLGLEIWPSNSQDLGKQMSSEIKRWAQVVEEAGIEKK